MKPLKQVERAAMWLYHDEYAAQRLGAIEFYKLLPPDKQQLVKQMIKEILEARP